MDTQGHDVVTLTRKGICHQGQPEGCLKAPRGASALPLCIQGVVWQDKHQLTPAYGSLPSPQHAVIIAVAIAYWQESKAGHGMSRNIAPGHCQQTGHREACGQTLERCADRLIQQGA